jgi:broad specificity phosphatase PhoE
MIVVLVRHGAVVKPRSRHVRERFAGARYDLLPLSAEGIRQVEATARLLRARGPRATLVIASPYSRTLHTAAILSRRLALPLAVELGLHDWLPRRDRPDLLTDAQRLRSHREMAGRAAGGPLPKRRRWESPAEVSLRAMAALVRYSDHEVVIAVTHELPIRLLAGGAARIPLGSFRVVRLG